MNDPTGTADRPVPPPGASPGERVLLFDGCCNLCSGVARFVIAHDRRQRIRLAALQSPAGRRLVEWLQLPEGIDTVVLVEDGRAFTRSTAVLRTLRRLPWPWSWLAAGTVVPRGLRDRAYDWLARRRRRWFGQRASCMAPAPEESARFLD